MTKTSKMNFFDVVKCPVDFETKKHGTVRVHDGWAAGGSWLLVEFLDGELAGKRLWMANDEVSATYFPNKSDDGFLFNRNPEVLPTDVQDEVLGGEYLPNLSGLTIKLR